MNAADEAKLRSSIHSTSEALVLRHVVGRCHGEELGPLCSPMPARSFADFSASLINLLSILLRMVSRGI